MCVCVCLGKITVHSRSVPSGEVLARALSCRNHLSLLEMHGSYLLVYEDRGEDWSETEQLGFMVPVECRGLASVERETVGERESMQAVRRRMRSTETTEGEAG